MHRFWLPLLVLIVLLLGGCGGQGGSESEFVTRAAEARLDPDAPILASREVGGYTVPLQIAQAFDNDLKQIRQRFPEVAGLHAQASYLPHELHFAVYKNAPWVAASWKSGKLPTGVAALDQALDEYGATEVRLLSEENDRYWFTVVFDLYLRSHRTAGVFVTTSNDLQLISAVSQAEGKTDIQYTFTPAGDNPAKSSFVFTTESQTITIERVGNGEWQKTSPPG